MLLFFLFTASDRIHKKKNVHGQRCLNMPKFMSRYTLRWMPFTKKKKSI